MAGRGEAVGDAVAAEAVSGFCSWRMRRGPALPGHTLKAGAPGGIGDGVGGTGDGSSLLDVSPADDGGVGVLAPPCFLFQ